MDAQLLIWIVEHYSKVGETILDPMAGSGTMMLACTLDRNCILVELEEKFCKMMQANWEQVKMRPQLGYEMGECEIIQGDARALDSILRVDKVITSPPYDSSDVSQTHMTSNKRGDTNNPGYRPSWKRKLAEGYAESKRPYHEIDAVVTSPPYGGSISGKDEQAREREFRYLESIGKSTKGTPGDVVTQPSQYSDSQDNIGNLPYGDIDAVISSPPFAETVAHSRKGSKTAEQHGLISDVYGAKPAYNGKWKPEDVKRRAKDRNIGHINILKNDGTINLSTYLSAMLQVYRQCWSVLKDGGLLILVTKNFIRNKQIVRLDTDTIKLCEQAGFSFLERHYRKLPSQSFWRVIYAKKHPEVEQINYEDVLVFERNR